MIGRTNTGGGAGGLNFQVIGGTTAPSNPKENMIWVNTSTKITSYIFSATEPEAPADGMVWITIGTESSVAFNALKKNGLLVYPISAKQYVDGAWVDKTAKSYQNGEWVDWFDGVLYDAGDECVTITGGWTNEGYYYDNGSNSMSITAPTKNADNMYIVGTAGSSGKLGGVGIADAVDLTGFSTVNFEIDVVSYGSQSNSGRFAVGTGKNVAEAVASAMGEKKTGIQTVSIDVSGLEGKHYVFMYLSFDASRKLYIKKARLKR